ncbi:Hypothetical predicted protein [Mytilus galloprovincialis]|uniref:Uncharacterized protein n=1 Tax=Mytilus galloprovincialis TaxID=29158 RepID=A0A8B6DS60_MYTGA|nr:Hypothetical predicted protein [Mytilus galloprovincialis]
MIYNLFSKGQCSLPDTLHDQYFRSYAGVSVWPFTESEGQFFTDYVTYNGIFPATFLSESPDRYDCKQNRGDYYLFKSENAILDQIENKHIFLCMKLTQIDTGKYALYYFRETATQPAGVTKGMVSTRSIGSPDPDICDICKMHPGVPGDNDFHIIVHTDDPAQIPTNPPQVPSPVPTVECGIPPECPGFYEKSQCVPIIIPTPIEIFCQFFLDNLEVPMGIKRGVPVRGERVLKELMTRHKKMKGKKGKKKGHYWKPKSGSGSVSHSAEENVCLCPKFDVLVTACEEIFGPINY